MGKIVRREMQMGFLVVIAVMLLGAAIMWADCGSDKQTPNTGKQTTLTNEQTPNSDTSPIETASTPTSQSEAAPALAEAFALVARRVAPMPVYGLAELPPGMELVDRWWPVVEVESPEQYQGPTVANPRIAHEGTDQPEAQIVFKWGAGWLAVLENFRGDVGITPGEEVGSVAGHKAMFYEINGGLLVQWSDGGRWYGVFARGVPKDDLIPVALEMQRVEY